MSAPSGADTPLPEGASGTEDSTSPAGSLRQRERSEDMLRRTLRDIERRLAVAYATCVTAQYALLAQNCEQDREIALCLRWGVCEMLSDQQRRLRALAASAAHGGSREKTDNTYATPADSTPSDHDSTAIHDDSVRGSSGSRPL